MQHPHNLRDKGWNIVAVRGGLPVREVVFEHPLHGRFSRFDNLGVRTSA